VQRARDAPNPHLPPQLLPVKIQGNRGLRLYLSPFGAVAAAYKMPAAFIDILENQHTCVGAARLVDRAERHGVWLTDARVDGGIQPVQEKVLRRRRRAGEIHRWEGACERRKRTQALPDVGAARVHGQSASSGAL